MPLPTTYHLLRTLTREGYLRRESGVFVISEGAESVGRAGARWRQRRQPADVLAVAGREPGAAVYVAVYREGEVEVVATTDDPARPPVEEWADFRSTAHAHAIGQCLLAQLDEATRKEHPARYPVQAMTPFSVPSEGICSIGWLRCVADRSPTTGRNMPLARSARRSPSGSGRPWPRWRCPCLLRKCIDCRQLRLDYGKWRRRY